MRTTHAIRSHMKARDLQNLLNRAAASLETPDDLTEGEKNELIEDLINAAMDVRSN